MNFDQEPQCEYWETPVVDSENLWLVRMLYTDQYAFFFFKKNHDSPVNEFHVMTISSSDPFRVTEEGLGWKVVGELLKNKLPSDRKKGKSYKVWNSSFAMMTVGALPITAEEYEKYEKFQYIIRTNDTWIEFVSFDIPAWEFHKNLKLDDLVIEYLKKDPWEQ